MKIHLFVIIFLFFFTSIGLADNYDFLDDTAGQYFTNEDWKIYLETQNKALNSTPDGKSITWRNVKSGSHGSLTPVHTIRKNGILCRDLKIINYANYRQGESTLTFCIENGKWKGI